MAKATPPSSAPGTASGRGWPAPIARQTASNELRNCSAAEVLAHGHAGLELHSLGGHLLQAAVDNVLLQLEIGDAVAQEAAHAVVLLEEHDLVAGADQLLGGGQSGRAGADHGHAAGALLPGVDGPDPALLEGPLRNLVFDLLDGDRRVVDGQRAGGFAGGRADAAGDLGEVVGGVEVFGGLAPAAVVDEVVELGDAVLHRAAGGVAEGDAAVHAAARLLVQHAGDQGPVDLVPVLDPLVDGAMPHFDAAELLEPGGIGHEEGLGIRD